MKKIRVGIIGCGRRMKDLLKLFLKNQPTCEIVALIDEDPKYAIEYQKEFLWDCPIFSSPQKAFSKVKLDWVLIGSKNSLHAEQIICALENGINVFVEKPLAIQHKDCLKVWRLKNETSLKLMIGFTLRFSPHYRKIAEMVHSGLIGDVQSFEFNETLDFWHGTHIMCNWRRFRENTGFHLLEKCCHDIDIANWIIQKRVSKVASFGGLSFFLPENKHLANELQPDLDRNRKPYERYGLNAFETQKDIVDHQVAILEYENGTKATFHTNLNCGIPERRLLLIGTKGAIRSDVLQGRIEYKKIGFNEKLVDYSIGNSTGGHGGGDEVLVKELQEYMTNDIEPAATVTDGINSAFVCFAIDEAQRNERIVYLENLWQELNCI